MELNDTSKKYFDVARPKSASGSSGTAPVLNPRRQMINIADDEKPPEESGPKSSTEDDNQPYDDTLMDQPEASESMVDSHSHPELVLATDLKKDDVSDGSKDNQDSQTDTNETKETDTPFVNPLPGTIEEEKPAEEEKPKEDSSVKQETESKTEDIKEASESVPSKTVGEKVIEPSSETENTKIQTSEKPEQDTPVPTSVSYSAIDALPENEETSETSKEEAQDPTIYDTKEYYVPIGNTYHNHGGLKMAFVFGLLCAVVVVGAILYYALVLSK